MHGVEDRVPFIFGGEASGDGKIPCLIWVGVTCGFYLIECPSGEPWWQETHFSLRYISIRRNAYHKEKTQLFVQTKPLQRRCNAWEDPVSTQIKSYMRWCSMSLTRHIQSYMKMHCNPPKGTEEPWTCAAHHLWHGRHPFSLGRATVHSLWKCCLARFLTTGAVHSEYTSRNIRKPMTKKSRGVPWWLGW